MDVTGGTLLYDEFMVHVCLAHRQPAKVTCQTADIFLRYRGPWRNPIMNIEKRNTKMFNILSIVFLAAILLTVVGGIIIQRQGLPSNLDGMNLSRDKNLMQPRSTQTSPTGELVVTAGIILLSVGFVISALTLLARRNWLLHNPS
jgi:hypothetical protein